jgi:hypothetical protein
LGQILVTLQWRSTSLTGILNGEWKPK